MYLVIPRRQTTLALLVISPTVSLNIRRIQVTGTMRITLSELPVEVLHQILSYIPPSSLPTVQTVSRQFNNLPQPLLWREHCFTHFKYWSAEHDLQQKFAGDVDKTDWKSLFSDRYSIDRSISREVDGILATQRKRIEKAENIMAHGYDAKDTLLRHRNVSDDAEDVLARRYLPLNIES